jgi:hypothetical protein
MAMAQGFTQMEVESILEDVDGSGLIDEKTRALLLLSEKITRESYKIHEAKIQEERMHGRGDF